MGPLNRDETHLGGTDGPAVRRFDRLDWPTVVVQRTDVPVLDDLSILLVQPAQGKTLRPADIRTRLVDSAPAVVVEEGAGALRAGFGACKPAADVSPDPVGFDLEYRQSIDAAVRAAQPTRDPVAEPAGNLGDLAIHISVQLLD
jgi:hypothetical protein